MRAWTQGTGPNWRFALSHRVASQQIKMEIILGLGLPGQFLFFILVPILYGT